MQEPGYKRPCVVFLCAANSCRSQMAEAWCHTLRPQLDVYSAGVLSAGGLNPRMVTVMKEVGIDLEKFGQKSKKLDTLLETGVKPDVVVTVCTEAAACPAVPTMHCPTVIRAAFDDPPQLEKATSTEQDALDCYRKVRDQIREYIIQMKF